MTKLYIQIHCTNIGNWSLCRRKASVISEKKWSINHTQIYYKDFMFTDCTTLKILTRSSYWIKPFLELFFLGGCVFCFFFPFCFSNGVFRVAIWIILILTLPLTPKSLTLIMKEFLIDLSILQNLSTTLYIFIPLESWSKAHIKAPYGRWYHFECHLLFRVWNKNRINKKKKKKK